MFTRRRRARQKHDADIERKKKKVNKTNDLNPNVLNAFAPFVMYAGPRALRMRVKSTH